MSTLAPNPRVVLLLALMASLDAAPLRAQTTDRVLLVDAIDSIANQPIAARKAAGMSVAVVRGVDTIVLQGYGHANLELDVPTPRGAVYEIGSVTKQFTAAAVLLLQERGKLSLVDDVTKFVLDYPTQGHHITIGRLLDHTSGIRGYTEIPAFWSTLAKRVLPRDSLVAMFAAEPFDFAPGDAMIYNNSAYFLLGLVIEQASGMSYEDFIEQEVFAAAGMVDSRYCSEKEIIDDRADGYQLGKEGLERADFLVHTWPYAAGSLCATAGDLVTWNRALHGHGSGGDFLTPESYREIITPGRLNDGTQLRYAKGLAITEPGGRKMISHGGGIFGFLSESRYYPEEDLIIVVLINTTGSVSPADIADAIEEVVLGPRRELPTRRFAGELSTLTGTYTGAGRGQELVVTVARDSSGLKVNIGEGEPRSLQYVEGLTFANGMARFHFVREGGKISGLRVDQVGGYYVLNRNKE